VNENRVISLEERVKDEAKGYLEELLSEGARKLLQAAIENKVIGICRDVLKELALLCQITHKKVRPKLLALHNPRLWGEGASSCASDGSRFESWKQNPMTEWRTRYCFWTVISTRRFFWRPSGSSEPSGFLFGAIGRVNGRRKTSSIEAC